MMFIQKLNTVVAKHDSLVCVGLDSDVDHQFVFNKAIIDATHDLVCAYKPNSAFYEARGVNGIKELKMTCDYLREKHPDIVIILDAKRGDIGSTNEGYVTYAFDWLGVDAITLHPYLGKEALKPFLDRKNKGCIILCKTSNPGAGELQDLNVDSGNQSNKLYQVVAEKIVNEWNSNGNCGLVAGATYPEELKIVRRIVGDMPLLVPGIGAQGGNMKSSVEAGLDSHHAGMIINASRSIIFASQGPDFAKKAREETQKLRNEINNYR